MFLEETQANGPLDWKREPPNRPSHVCMIDFQQRSKEIFSKWYKIKKIICKLESVTGSI